MFSCIFLFLLYASKNLVTCTSLWCYACVSSQPGCDEHYVDWRIHHAITCPRDDDKCVKIIEQKGVDKFITRDCLSNLESQRKDIPADRYDGCRKAAAEPKLAVYVENTISQLEIKDRHWKEVTYCFCEFDQWCNQGFCSKSCSLLLAALLLIYHLFIG